MLDDDLGFSDVTVEVATKTGHVVPINKLIEWRVSHSPSPRELTRKMNTRMSAWKAPFAVREASIFAVTFSSAVLSCPQRIAAKSSAALVALKEVMSFMA